MSKQYDKIDVLSTFDGIRMRSGMYIGETNDPTHLFIEVLDNSIDESISGYCDTINITINDDQSFTITDNGRGIPYGWNEHYQEYDAILACTQLHSGGKFSKSNYNISSGLNGVGLTAVNALSDEFYLVSTRDGKEFHAKFIVGEKQYVDLIPLHNKTEITGTSLYVKPTSKYFESIVLNKNKILSKLKLVTTFIPNLKITLNNEIIPPYTKSELCEGCTTEIIDLKLKLSNGESVEVYLSYAENDTKSKVKGSVNLLDVNQGAHISLLEKSVVDAWKLIVDGEVSSYLNDSDYLVGFRGFILINLIDPSYSSQTKEKLTGSIDKKYKYIKDELVKFIYKKLKSSEYDKLRLGLINKFKDYRSNHNKLSAHKYIDEVIVVNKNKSDDIDRSVSGTGVSKLIDCYSSDRTDTMIYLVEGDSAGGSLITRRDIEKHAILPLRGKVLNVVGEDLKRILDNLEVRSLINALGTSCLSREDPTKIRYDKVVISVDADSDGDQIAALLLGAFCYLTPKLVKAGRIYLAHPCLFGQYDKNGNFIPYWSQEDADPKRELFRFKGLGSMSPDDIYKVLLDPQTRKLSQLVAESDDDIARVLSIVGNPNYRTTMLINEGLIK